MDLKQYMIDTANEGLIFNKIIEEYIDRIKNGKSLLIFSPDSITPYGGIQITKYLKLSGFTTAISLNLVNVVDWMITDEKPIWTKYSTTQEKELSNLIYKEFSKLFSKNAYDVKRYEKVFLYIDKWAKNNKTFVGIVINNSQLYANYITREYPVIIADPGKLLAYANVLGNSKYISEDIGILGSRYKALARFNTSIPERLVVNKLNFPLYHCSTNGTIKELTPRITTKPMLSENIRIPRVSAASTIDACFKALELYWVNKTQTIYVYELQITSNCRVIKPDASLVPDVSNTNEYWVLDPVKVKLLGTIDITYNPKTRKQTYEYKLPFNPLLVPD